jgi:plasmid stabilization system protein ParE
VDCDTSWRCHDQIRYYLHAQDFTHIIETIMREFDPEEAAESYRRLMDTTQSVGSHSSMALTSPGPSPGRTSFSSTERQSSLR